MTCEQPEVVHSEGLLAAFVFRAPHGTSEACFSARGIPNASNAKALALFLYKNCTYVTYLPTEMVGMTTIGVEDGEICTADIADT